MRSGPRQFSLWTLMLVALRCARGGFAQDTPANKVTPRVTPIPSVTGPIPVTADSRPFLEAAKLQTPVDLAAHGYVEEEFFVSGTGNVYDWAADGTVTIKAADRPYTTRILLRRPSDPSRFSGTVLTEILHSAMGADNNLMWGFAGNYVMSHGDAYVGITVSSNTIGALKVFNSTRYASLAFPAPVPGICGEQAGARGGGGGRGGGGRGGGDGGANPRRPAQFFPPADDSVHWDIISQVGALLKSNVPSKPLAGFNVRYIFATDHTASEAHTYARAFAKLATLPNGKPVYDGFLIKEGAGIGAVNGCGQRIAPDDPRRAFKNIGVPVIFLLSQNYVARFVPIRREDSDAPGDQYRLYEVPGASHLDKWTFLNLAPLKTERLSAPQRPEGYGRLNTPVSRRSPCRTTSQKTISSVRCCSISTSGSETGSHRRAGIASRSRTLELPTPLSQPTPTGMRSGAFAVRTSMRRLPHSSSR